MIPLHVSSILRLEEHYSSPVVRLVLNKAARRARRSFRNVVGRVHGDIEGITTNDLVEMRGVFHAGIDKWVGSLDNEL